MANLTLKQKAQNILDEKTAHLLPTNLKSGVSALGVNGALIGNDKLTHFLYGTHELIFHGIRLANALDDALDSTAKNMLVYVTDCGATECAMLLNNCTWENSGEEFFSVHSLGLIINWADEKTSLYSRGLIYDPLQHTSDSILDLIGVVDEYSNSNIYKSNMTVNDIIALLRLIGNNKHIEIESVSSYTLINYCDMITFIDSTGQAHAYNIIADTPFLEVASI